MGLLSIVGLSIVSAALCILLKQYHPEFAVLASVACGTVIFFAALTHLTPVFNTLGDLMGKFSIDSSYVQVVMKSLGICYITQLAVDTCNDSGQAAIAGKVELMGKVAILVICMPLFTNLVDIALGLINL